MIPKLSILIPTLEERQHLFKRLIRAIEHQVGEVIRLKPGKIVRFEFDNQSIEVLAFKDNKELTVGSKRNELLQSAKGEYVAFIDDDDRIGENYFKRVFEGIDKGVDCCSLKGIITENGNNPLLFEHSIRYKEYKTNNDAHTLVENQPRIKYERYPNHLNTIKASIAKQFAFPEKNHGEDTDFATQIFKSGLIRTEHYIEETLYHYDWRSKN